MTILNGFIDYRGDLGGFTVDGHYSGIANTQLSLVSEDKMVLASSGSMNFNAVQSDMFFRPSGNFDLRCNEFTAQAVSDVNFVVTGGGQILFETDTSFIHLDAGEDVRFTTPFDVVSTAGDDHNISSSRDHLVDADRYIVFDNSQNFKSQGISGISRTKITMQASGMVMLDSPNGNIELQASGNLNHAIKGNLTATIEGEMNYQVQGTNGVTINAGNGSFLMQSAGGDFTAIGEEARLSGSDITIVDSNSSRGILINQTPGGTGPIRIINDGGINGEGIVQVYGPGGVEIASHINQTNGFGHPVSGISAGDMVLHSSGTMDIRSINGGMNLISSGAMTIGQPDASWSFDATGSVIYTSPANAGYTILPGGNLLLSCNGIGIYAGGVVAQLTCANGPTTVTSQLSTTTITSEASNTFVGSKGGQLTLDPWNGSGQLDYRFGPNEAWHTSPSSSSDFFPIPHSGQIVQMILEQAPGGGGSSSLQDAYEIGNSITIKGGSDLLVTSDADKFRIGTNSTRPHMNMSGVLSLPVGDPERGDIWLSIHEQVEQPSSASDQAEADALSLGPSTLTYNSGSGIANISTGSGITQLINSAAVTINSNTYVPITWDETGGLGAGSFRDGHYAHANASNAEDIRVMVDGLYKVYYILNMDIATAATAHDTVGSILTINGTAASVGMSYVYLQRGSNAAAGDERVASATALLNLDAGDIINVEARLEDNNGYSVQTIADESWLIVEYVGPKRSL